MNADMLISLVEQYGYVAMFFALWLGIIGLPVPDEVIVMTGGMVASMGMLHPVPAFLVTYLGVVSGLSLGYVLGRRVGAPVLEKLVQKKKAGSYLLRSQRLIERTGGWALCLSYFLPVVRHLLPYLVGIGKMEFRRFALISYGTGLVWTLVYFLIGTLVGNQIDRIGTLVHRYGMYTLIVCACVGLVYWLQGKLRRNAKMMR